MHELEEFMEQAEQDFKRGLIPVAHYIKLKKMFGGKGKHLNNNTSLIDK